MTPLDRVFILTSGTYSDYHIDGVFSTKEGAERFAGPEQPPDKQHRNPWHKHFTVEEHPLDPGLNHLPPGLSPWSVCMLRDGTTTFTDILGPDHLQWVGGAFLRGSWDTSDYTTMHWVGFARDEAHAVKIANEVRTRAIAENRWPEELCLEPDPSWPIGPGLSERRCGLPAGHGCHHAWELGALCDVDLDG